MSVWHFDFKDPTVILLQMSDGDINSLRLSWVCRLLVEQSMSGAGVDQFQATAAWELEHANLELTYDCDIEWEKNFPSRQILKHDKSQGKLLHNSFDMLLWLPSMWAAVNIALKVRLCKQNLLQTSLYSQGTHTVCMAYPQWSMADSIDLYVQEDCTHFSVFESIFVSYSEKRQSFL